MRYINNFFRHGHLKLPRKKAPHCARNILCDDFAIVQFKKSFVEFDVIFDNIP